jgi:hypothetical protein
MTILEASSTEIIAGWHCAAAFHGVPAAEVKETTLPPQQNCDLESVDIALFWGMTTYTKGSPSLDVGGESANIL